ncbi:MAG: class I SAM-dependent methyltransferase [Deltaproteobacteria bacterium]
MDRICEPELMDEKEQAKAYAAADFEEPHNRVVDLFGRYFPARQVSGTLLDLGCGPGDICFRLVRRFPDLVVHGIDGSEAMLELARQRLQNEPDFEGRLHFARARIPQLSPSADRWDTILCTSLLHHLHRPQDLWEAIKRLADEKTFIFVIDLYRPESVEKAEWIVDHYSGAEPEILKRDFFNSLLAAFTPLEVEQQLVDCGLSGLAVSTISDRHLMIHGFKAGSSSLPPSSAAISSNS